MRKLIVMLVVMSALSTVYGLRGLEIPCYGQAWDLTACKALTTKPDGTVHENTFFPENKTIRSCFLAGCDPVYCSNWRENIRSVCKNEYENMVSRFFGAKREEGPVRFEGCVYRPVAKGVLGWLDWGVRKVAPESLFNVCTTISPEEESVLKSTFKKIWQKGNETTRTLYKKAVGV